VEILRWPGLSPYLAVGIAVSWSALKWKSVKNAIETQ
jgi:hypothetical protein